jgi:O-antigen ligase
MTWLCWGHLASFAVLVPLATAGELGILSELAPGWIAAGSVAIFLGFTFWLLPNRPGLPRRAAVPIALALTYYLASYASGFSQQNSYWSYLTGVPFGSLKYVVALLGIASVRYFVAILGLIVVYFCAANVPRSLAFGYLLFSSAFVGVVLGVVLHTDAFSHIRIGLPGHGLYVGRIAVLYAGNANGTGTLLLLYGALGYALIGASRQRALKTALALALAILAACFAVTLSRGAFLGLAAMIAAAPALLRKRGWWRLPVLVLIVFAVLFWLFAQLHLRTAPEVTLAGRLQIWQDALRVFATHPLFGTGVENQLVQSPPDPLGNCGLVHAHNAFLNLLAEAGLVGTALILWASAAVCGMLWRIAAMGRDKPLGALAFGALLGLVGMVAADLVNVEWRGSQVRIFVTILLAAILGAWRSERVESMTSAGRPQSGVAHPRNVNGMRPDQSETAGPRGAR